MEPILFVTVGSTLDFSEVSGGTVPRAVCIVLTGVTLRTLCTYLVMCGFNYTNKEKLFFALAWTPKATVQAALSGMFLHAVINKPYTVNATTITDTPSLIFVCQQRRR
jgi:Kef-type K+ transport system membrane component KefB